MKTYIKYINILLFSISSLLDSQELVDREGRYGSKTVIINTNDGSKVTLDKTIPTLVEVELTTNNKNSNYASVGDELVLKASASEGIVKKNILINAQNRFFWQ